MLQAANNDLFNPLARNSEPLNLVFPLQIKPIKVIEVKLADFYNFAPSRVQINPLVPDAHSSEQY